MNPGGGMMRRRGSIDRFDYEVAPRISQGKSPVSRAIRAAKKRRVRVNNLSRDEFSKR